MSAENSGERKFRKPLLIGGVAAGVAGAGWLAWGIRHRYNPEVAQEQLRDLFANREHQQHLAAVMITGRLLRDKCVGMDALRNVVQIELPGVDELHQDPRINVNRAMELLGNLQLGSQDSLTTIVTRADHTTCRKWTPEVEERIYKDGLSTLHYEITPEAERIVRAGRRDLFEPVYDYLKVIS